MKSNTQTAVAIVLIVVAISGVVLFLPSFHKLTIDENWLIIYNANDRYDTWAAGLIAGTYGAELQSIHSLTDDVANNKSQNLLFIGASDEYSRQVPWADPHRPTLSILRPQAQPDVYYDYEGWDNGWVQTPQGRFYSMSNGTTLHDYGYITTGWDSSLQRYVILCVGWSAASTGAGAKIITTQFNLIQQHNWIVYEVDLELWENNQDVSDWDSLSFDPVVVAHG